MSTTKNKIRFGLKNVHYAKLTKTLDEDTGAYTYTYGDVKAFPGAVNLSLSPEGDASDEYADDEIWSRLNANNGYSGDYEYEVLPEDFATAILGLTKTTGGVFIEKSDVDPSPFALMFEIAGDATKRRYLFYEVNTTRPSDEGSTKTDSISPIHGTMTFAARPRSTDKKVKAYVDEGATDYSTWFSKVWEESTTTTTSGS